jgi:hypothetical protein
MLREEAGLVVRPDTLVMDAFGRKTRTPARRSRAPRRQPPI